MPIIGIPIIGMLEGEGIGIGLVAAIIGISG
jgi:hypothetical protein